LVFGKLQQFLFQQREFFLRQAVGESKGDGLEEFFGVPVWEIAAGIPFFGSADVPVGFFGDLYSWGLVGRRGRRRS
jgi:hypothetical protein